MFSHNDIFWIVSTFNQDPTLVLEELSPSSFLVCNQGESHFVPNVYRDISQYKETKHSGHNISDYLRYIIDHYDHLPNRLGFIKGNVFPRHISKHAFNVRKKEEGFVPLYSDEATFNIQKHRLLKNRFVAQQISPGYYLELNNNWYCKHRKEGKFFPKLEDFFLHFFGRHPPKYVPFVPGGCMIVPSSKIRRWPVQMYEEMYEAVTYNFFPVEAFHVERSMLYLFDFPRV